MKILIFTAILFFLFATPAHAQVVISEVYPAPTSEEKEWIKVLNTGSETIDISGWKLFEHFSSKNELTTITDVILESGEIYTYTLESNKLNNSEEKVTLENLENEEISSVHYTNAEPQKSITFFSENTPNEDTNIEPTAVPNVTPTTKTSSTNPSNQQHKTQIENTREKESHVEQTIPEINEKLELHKKVVSLLKLPSIEKIEKENLEKVLPKFSYIVQNKVSKTGVISAIIGGLLVLTTGILL